MENLQTPPDTLTVRKKLLRTNISRVALAEKQANTYGLQGVETPISGGIIARAVEVPAIELEGSESFMDIVLYRNPPLSFLVVFAGTLSLTTTHYIISGAHSMTIVSFICYLLLLELAVNFARSVFSSNPSSGKWQGSGIVTTALNAVSLMMDHVASIHDQLLTMENPALALRVGACLWAVAIAGQLLSAWTLAALGFASTFTLPYALYTNKDSIDAVCSGVAGAAHARWAALGISRKQKAAGLFVLICTIWMRISWSNRLIGLLMGALAIRCNLKPAEVAAIREHAAPLTISVKKRAARMSIAASDFAQRTLGNKMHFR